MKKQLLVFTFLLLLIPMGCKILEKKQDLKGYLQARWGMSKKGIKQLIELQITDETDNNLIFSDVIGEDNVTKLYMFGKEDKLFAVMIIFELPSQDENLFRNKFRETYNTLMFKYKSADKYHEKELDENGLSAIWEFKTTTIYLNMKMAKPQNVLVLAVLYMNDEYAGQYFNTYPIDKY